MFPPTTTSILDSNSIMTKPGQQSNTRSEAQKERVSTACTYCRYRKVKCDGGKPSCNFCVHMGRSDCVYAKVSEEENQHLRKRKRELRARRAAERLQEQQEQQQSESPSLPINIPFNSSSSASNSDPSSSSGQLPKRRRSSIPKRARAKTSMESESSSSDLFSLSAPSLQEFTSNNFTLTGLPTELTNTISPNFLELLTPRSSIASLLDGTTGLDLHQTTQPSLQQSQAPNIFMTNTAVDTNNDTFGVNQSFDWSFSHLPASTREQIDSFAVPEQASGLTQQKHEETGLQSQSLPETIFTAAAQRNSFLNQSNGSFELNVPNFNGPPFQLTSTRALPDSGSQKDIATTLTTNAEDETKVSKTFLGERQSSLQRGGASLSSDKTDVKAEESTKLEQAKIEQKSSLVSNESCESFSGFVPSQQAQSIFDLWPSSRSDNIRRFSTTSNFLPSPMEPSSLPELKRFFHTTNNPFVYNPITPLIMSLPSSEKLPWDPSN